MFLIKHKNGVGEVNGDRATEEGDKHERGGGVDAREKEWMDERAGNMAVGE